MALSCVSSVLCLFLFFVLSSLVLCSSFSSVSAPLSLFLSISLSFLSVLSVVPSCVSSVLCLFLFFVSSSLVLCSSFLCLCSSLSFSLSRCVSFVCLVCRACGHSLEPCIYAYTRICACGVWRCFYIYDFCKIHISVHMIVNTSGFVGGSKPHSQGSARVPALAWPLGALAPVPGLACGPLAPWPLAWPGPCGLGSLAWAWPLGPLAPGLAWRWGFFFLPSC